MFHLKGVTRSIDHTSSLRMESSTEDFLTQSEDIESPYRFDEAFFLVLASVEPLFILATLAFEQAKKKTSPISFHLRFEKTFRRGVDPCVMTNKAVIIALLILCATLVTPAKIPSIPNVTFVPISPSNSTTITHRTCKQCLCDSYSSYMILNCFPNDTCQFFVDAPRTYKLQPTPNALLYFPRQILPDPSESCIPNTSFLLSQLNASTPTYANVPLPLCIALDNNGYLVTVSRVNRSIVRFHASDLTRIDQPPSPIFIDDPESLAHHNGVYYVGFQSYILAVDGTTLSQIGNISTSFLNSARDILFLNDGQHMIVASLGNHRLLFFNRSSVTSHSYDYIDYRTVECRFPHGLFRGNDTFFYATSSYNNTVYAYANAGNITEWTETLVLNASLATSPSNGYHISVDSGGRYWFSLGTYGVTIFDSRGSPLGFLYPTGSIDLRRH